MAATTSRINPASTSLAEVVNAPGRCGAFASGDRGFANGIRGCGQPPPPDPDIGHFHLDYGEFWYMLQGQIDYLIEGVPFFSEQQDDVVQAVQNTAIAHPVVATGRRHAW